MGFFNFRSGTVRFEDATGVGVTAGPTDGDFTHSDTNAENTAKNRVLDRGVFDCHTEGDDLEQTWSITLKVRAGSLTSTSVALARDFLDRVGVFDPNTGSQPTATVANNTDLWAFKVIVSKSLGASSGGITLPLCMGSYAYTEGAEFDTFTVSGTNNGKPIYT